MPKYCHSTPTTVAVCLAPPLIHHAHCSIAWRRKRPRRGSWPARSLYETVSTFISLGMPTAYVLRCCIRSRCAKLGCSSPWFVSFNFVCVILASYILPLLGRFSFWFVFVGGPTVSRVYLTVVKLWTLWFIAAVATLYPRCTCNMLQMRCWIKQTAFT